MRIVCLMISFGVHACLAMAVVYFSFHWLPGPVVSEQVYEVDLVRPVQPTAPCPAAQPGPSRRPVASQSSQPATVAPPTPAEISPKIDPKAKGKAPSVAKPRVSSARARFKMRKPESFGPLWRPDAAGAPAANATRTPLPTTAQRGDTTYVAGLHGFAAFADTFALDRVGADTFTPEDYFGHYHVGPKRFVSVLDGQKEYGAYLFYDSQTGLFRILDHKSSMIFTYGRSFREQDPSVGTVTILPKKDRYDNEHIRKPAQLIWMTDKPPMHYGTRIEFSEQTIEFERDGKRFEGTLVTRPGAGARPGVVLVFSTQCLARGKGLWFAQVLALHGLAVLVYDSPDCEGSVDGAGQPLEPLARDALAALEELAQRPEVDKARVGLWGQNSGTSVAIRAAALSQSPAFVVTTYSKPEDQSTALRRDLARVSTPSLYLFSGRAPQRQWQEMIGDLGALSKTPEVRTLRDLGEDEDPDAEGLKPLSLRYARIAGPWINDLGDQ